MERQESTPRIVTVDNFVRAETDMTMARYVAQGGFARIMHLRQPVPLDKQDVIRMNRDTLYSIGVFDLTSPVTITKPDPSDRFQSMMFVSEDHSILPAEYDGGEFPLTKEMIGTRYVFVIFRTFMDPADPDDIAAANSLQDGIRWAQADPGVFEVPDWDEPSLRTVRQAINVLAATKPMHPASSATSRSSIPSIISSAQRMGGAASRRRRPCTSTAFQSSMTARRRTP